MLMLRIAIVLTLLLAMLPAIPPVNGQQPTMTPAFFEETSRRSPSLDHALAATTSNRGTGEDTVVVARLSDLTLHPAGSTAFTLMHRSSIYGVGTPNLLQVYADVSDRWVAERRTHDRTSVLIGWSADHSRTEADGFSGRSSNRVLKLVARFFKRNDAGAPLVGQHIGQCGSLQISPMPCVTR
jgi:hypothetical protein